MNYSWDWGLLFRSPHIDWLIEGFRNTVVMAVLAWFIAMSLGSLIGVMRTLDNPVAKRVGTIYVEIFRNIPLLAQLFLWYYVIPELLPAAAQKFVKRDMADPQFWTSVVGLGCYTAARVAEQVRSGIQSIPRGQRAAALAMGFSTAQVYRYVLLPIGFRTVIPSLTNDFLGVFKNSSLALTLGVMELTAAARQIEEYTFHSFEPFAAATVLYSCVTLLVITLMRVIERRTRIAGSVGSGR
ncbi:MAG: His/Glu/Gln/Arg/opine family amino transporter, permease, region [Rhodospirillales bacterium]|nr:His/Glu/Gln/Arg/opine family amino transporter, permease, region [Rhodospirillales bacterium]